MGRDSLSVWTVSLTDESRYQAHVCMHACTVCVCTSVLTATWQTALSGVHKGRVLRREAFKTCFLAQTAPRIFIEEAAA